MQSTLAPTSRTTEGDAGEGGHDDGERGAIDAGQGAEDHFGGGHAGSGIAGGEEAGGALVLDHFEAEAHGAVALGADGVGGLLVHGDELVGVDDFDGEALAVEGVGELAAEDGLGSDEVDADLQGAAGENRASDFRLGGFVGAHGVESDVSEHGQLETRAAGELEPAKERAAEDGRRRKNAVRAGAGGVCGEPRWVRRRTDALSTLGYASLVSRTSRSL